MSTDKVVGQLGRIEFISLVAGLIAINAFAIDIMLPGLQQIGESLGEADENRRQLVIPAYMLGFGVLQLVFGPLADRFGRRVPLLCGVGIYMFAALSANFVSDFNTLIALRFLQGAGAAASAVIGIALVRDLFVGDQMAKTLSLVFMVMMVSPILAPALGQFLLTMMSWKGLFAFMAGLGGLVWLWIFFRLPETLKPENQRAFTFKSIIEGFGIVFGNRTALSYIMATAVLFGALMGFLTSSPQIYQEFGMAAWFPVFFAIGGIAGAISGFANSQLVTRFGMEKLSSRALNIFAANSVVVLVLGLAGLMNVWTFLRPQPDLVHELQLHHVQFRCSGHDAAGRSGRHRSLHARLPANGDRRNTWHRDWPILQRYHGAAGHGLRCAFAACGPHHLGRCSESGGNGLTLSAAYAPRKSMPFRRVKRRHSSSCNGPRAPMTPRGNSGT